MRKKASPPADAPLPAQAAVQKPTAPTMSDVAELAGVSPMTVSRVMNGDPKVRDKTRVKVMEAVAALNYTPNQVARRLAGSHAMRVGFLYSNPSAGYISEFLVGLLNQASSNNVQLVVEKCADDASEQVRRLIANGIDGIIVPPPLCDDRQLIDLITEAGTPAVTVARGVPDPRVGGVSIDDYQAAYGMASHLVALGHQRIGFIAGNPNQSVSARRLAGFKAAMAEHKLADAPELVVQGLFTYRSGLDAAESLLALATRPTAIFASNDDMAAAVVAVAHRMGLDVPGDLTVAGFDDTPLATTIWPELTTVRQPIADMAEAAVRLVVQQIRSKRDGGDAGPVQTVMDYTLVRRQSDAAPRTRPPGSLAAKSKS
ncbi:LacI family DNA-binding transcriptional regulator [Pseudoduganella ginsengisoli]|uniref:Substrate-binding domain-containing protein n=1 Tax=Pseudoduganella ginsengisoli TaxID=1462440 RepID=A0A6L6Q8J4_9BURK|nr:LacI family DNA-binding transcriptional regulator [Pseudoduganella ginsengisoli]MTW06107.1 substrate-binding domain-containing protein [Pseudoduganella ginsengisoli]